MKQPDIAAYAVVAQLQNITLPKLQPSIRAQLAEGELAYLNAQTVAEQRGGLFPPEKPAKKSGHILALGSEP